MTHQAASLVETVVEVVWTDLNRPAHESAKPLGAFFPGGLMLGDKQRCTLLLPGRKSAFRAGIGPDCCQENTDIGAPAGRRLAK